jgi:hypothetical protein
MKKKSSQNLYVELLVTIFVAFVLSLVVATVLVFIVGQFGTVTQSATSWINAASSALAGLAIGYRLNTILAHVPKTRKK